MKTLDLTKPLQTRDGSPVRIGFTNLKSPHPIVAAVQEKDGSENLCLYRLDGTCGFPSLDLVNVPFKVPEKITVWINIYPEHSMSFGQKAVMWHLTKEEADKNAKSNRIACIQASFTEGIGLQFTAENL